MVIYGSRPKPVDHTDLAAKERASEGVHLVLDDQQPPVSQVLGGRMARASAPVPYIDIPENEVLSPPPVPAK